MIIRTRTHCLGKRLVWSVALLICAACAKANNYYFSTTYGDDNRSAAQAQNETTPWKSIDKLNAVFSQLTSGDNVYFKSGDIFYGAIIASKSGPSGGSITFSSYGTGSKPQITGFVAVTGWYNTGGQIWEATVPMAQQRVNSVLFNNQFTVPGRYPNADATNSGYLSFETAIGNTSIIDLQLSGYPSWTGGEVVIRKNRWVLDRNPISLHIGNILNYVSQSNYSTTAGYGYFIQNHPATLDRQGEWYYRPTGKKFGIQSASQPADGSVKVSTIQNLVSIDGQTNLVFSNLSFTGANGNAFNITNSRSIQVKNCDLLYSGVDAVVAGGCTGLVLEGNTMNLTSNTACLIQYCNDLIIRNNTITNTGTVAGMGEGGSGSYQALILSGDNQLVEGNTINNTGYSPVSFGGSNVVIKNNLIDGFAFVKDDGGGIYTWNNSQNPPNRSGQVVSGNIVLNGLGAGAGTTEPDKAFAQGIYMDDNSFGVEINGNTVANCNGNGIFIHNAHDLVVKNNTVFNNKVQLEMTHDDVAPIPITNVTLTGNTFVSKQIDQTVAEFKTNGNDMAAFGNFDNNYYSRPLQDYLQIGVLYKENWNYKWGMYSVNGWKALYGKDLNSKASPFSIASFKVNSLNGNNLYSNGNFDNNINGLYAYSSAGNATTSWNGSGMDGGALQVNFPWQAGNGSKATVIIGVGSINAGKNYVLRFSVKGADENKSMDAYLRISGAPYSEISPRKSLPVPGNRVDYEVLLQPTASEGNASIGLDIPEQNGPVYIDNIQLTEANVSMTNPDDSIRLVYNAFPVGQATSLNGSYADIANNSYNSSISLSPYGSAVLLKKRVDQPVEEVVCQATGVIVREQWNNIDGTAVSAIPVQTAPSGTTQLNSFEAPSNIGDQYGARIRGYICPPQTGNYTFFIASDDNSELWLSTDDNPDNKAKIAYNLEWTNSQEYTKYASQRSVAIYLQAGHKYYIEALHKEGGGGDNLSVAWQLPNGTMEAPIAGSRLSSYTSTTTNPSPQTIDFQPVANLVEGAAPFTITATASSGLPVSVTVVSGPASVSGNTVTVNGVGTVVLQATQTGNNTYAAAAPVTQSFTVTAAPQPTACTGSGTITREQWDNIKGNDISNIPVQTSPGSISQLTLFEAPSNIGNNYGARMRGFVCPPQTGYYTFWIASDDASELWLSTSEDPAEKVKIAYSLSWTNIREYNKYASQKSVAIYLKSGYRYYIEALHKEGNGADNLSVAWQLPNGQLEAPIPGNRLSPYAAESTACSGAGSISREQWDKVGGTSVSNIPLQTAPSSTDQLPLFEAPSNIANYYGARVSGYICPPQTGYYTFWIAGDDATELWLSTSDDPANKVKIAYNLNWTDIREYDKYASQKSVAIYLKSGYRYYVEALHKEGYGGDNLSVAWQLPNGELQAPIPGSCLIPYINNTSSQYEGVVATAVGKSSSTAMVKSKSVEASVKAVNTANKLSVTPSLVSGTAAIEIQLITAGKIRVDVLDQQGRMVKQIMDGTASESTLRQRFTLYTAGLGNGLYLVRLTTQSGVLVQKIVISR